MSSESPAFASQASSYGAEQTRRAVFLPFASTGGVKASGDLAVTAPVSGMTVNVATGEVLVPGSSSAVQGLYYGRVSSTSNLAVAASNPSNPRIDMIYAVITDSAYTGATNTFTPAVATGTPTAGATLVNLTGAPSLPTSSIILAYVLVPAASTSVTSPNVLDQRVRFVISNAASLVSSSTQAFAGSVSTPALTATGQTGAVVQVQWSAGTASGAPITGTWPTNAIVPDSTGKLWYCTAGGSPGTWVQVGSSSGPAMIRTFANASDWSGVSAISGANRALYVRVVRGGTITKIAIHVGTSNGNISLAVCRGAAGLASPTSRVVTTGAIACPAGGYAESTVSSTVVDDTTDWLALSADGVTATFAAKTGTGTTSNLNLGTSGLEVAAHPVPASPAPTVTPLAAYPVLIGVP